MDSLVEDSVEAVEVHGDEKTVIISAFEGVVCMLMHVLNQQHGLVPGLT